MPTITSRLVHQAKWRGASTAVVADDLTLSWESLCDLSLRTSSLLRTKGIEQGDRVALLCGNSPAFLVSWFGLANIGAITVSLNTGLVGDGLRYSIIQSDAKAILIERAIFEAKSSDLERVLDGRELIVFDGDAGLIDQAKLHAPDSVYEGDAADPVSIIYTSGTTGLPKGVLNCHQAFLESGRWMARHLRIDETDRIMVFLPLFHTNPQMYAVMSALETGCTLVIRPRFSVSKFFDDARRFQCTMFTYVGSVLSMLTSRIKATGRDHMLTRCVGGGCPSEVWRVMEDRFGIVPYELYGMTEIGGWVTGNSVENYRTGSCGKARPDVSVQIVDANDNFVAPGIPGEIVVRPEKPNVLLLEYWNNPKATLEASRNFWFHTGDLGQLDDEGFLYFKGRLKEIIRRGGENISPFELEIALLDHPDVQDAAVVGMPDPIYDEEIKAVLVCKSPIEPGSIRAFLEGRVPSYMMPRYVQFIDAIPRTETQKIQRHLLQQRDDGVIDLAEEQPNA